MPIVRVALPVPLPQCFDYLCDEASAADIGRCVRVPFGRGQKIGLIVALPTDSDIDPARLKPVDQVLRSLPPLPAHWLALVEFVARYYHAPLGEVVALALPPDLRRADPVGGQDDELLLALSPDGEAALQASRPSRTRNWLAGLQASGGLPARASSLREQAPPGALAEARRRGWLQPLQGADPAQAGEVLPEPTAQQAQVLAALEQGGEGFHPWLLHGVTGAGKTEIYLRRIAAELKQGRQVLVLVPEIGLTPQLEERVRARFPFARVVSLHSAVADGQRSRGYLQALRGEADIVLGTRLAVFTPCPRLGLIIVDEEHDPSYKQQEGVRYSARDVAVWRARALSIPVLLGSATPSLESWRAAEQGRYRLLQLDQRARAQALPTVRLIDTRRLTLEEGLSPPLLQALAERLARGEQSLVFLNRRGYAPVLACPACGWVSACTHCSANRVVHLAEKRLRCHHCGTDAPIPRACPNCGNQDIRPFGRGTQRLEEGLKARFPQARVLRLDRDAARSRNQWQSLLAQVGTGEADILVGTQIMAKGHDFPRLTLVGVVGADASLYAADFRAPERLFQQLMQVGGRAGRAELPGEVLIQTEFPQHPLYACLARQDYPGFARMALDERASAGFPPFSHQAMLRADAPQLDDALAFLKAAIAAAPAGEGVRLFDPVPMRLTRLARRERAQLLIEADQRPPLQAFLAEWRGRLYRLPAPAALRWHLDVDPLDI